MNKRKFNQLELFMSVALIAANIFLLGLMAYGIMILK